MNYKTLGISTLLSIISGLAISLLVIGSENGYVGSMVFGLLFFLILFVVLVLLVSSLFCLSFNKDILGLCLLISALLLPSSFLLSCLIAKYFEIGAYRQEPMIPFPVATNIALTKQAGKI